MKRKRLAAKDDYPRPWEDGPISLERWRRHRAKMLARAMEGQRPDEWWIHERGIEPPENQTSVLYDAGELSAREINFLMAFWRRDYAITMAFATESEQRAHIRTMGIPIALVRQWHGDLNASVERKSATMKPVRQEQR
jgi:hypothetical protein